MAATTDDVPVECSADVLCAAAENAARLLATPKMPERAMALASSECVPPAPD